MSKLGCGNQAVDYFNNYKNSLANQVMLSHRDSRRRLSVSTDAMDLAWSGILTQVHFLELSKPHLEQSQYQMAFLSCRFNATKGGWAKVEKEAYSDRGPLDRIHWLTAAPDEFDIYSDHNNLISYLTLCPRGQIRIIVPTKTIAPGCATKHVKLHVFSY